MPDSTIRAGDEVIDDLKAFRLELEHETGERLSLAETLSRALAMAREYRGAS